MSRKEVSIYPVDKVKTVKAFLQLLQREFPGVPYGDITLEIGLALWCSAVPKSAHPRGSRRRTLKAELR